MFAYFRKTRDRCWKIYDKYYRSDVYKHHTDRYDETIMRYLKPDTILLDAGCGSEMTFTCKFAQKIRVTVGVDIGDLKTPAPGLSGVRGDLHNLPFKDGVFDIVVSMSVFEHLSDPRRVFDDVSRVLKPKGIVVLQTPNKYDYISFIARLTPFWFHRWILSNLLGRSEDDTFPTFFRANTRKEIRAFLIRSNLIPLRLLLFNQYPAYLMFSPVLFRLGVLYERLTSRLDILAQLRGWILAVAEKKGVSDCGSPLPAKGLEEAE